MISRCFVKSILTFQHTMMTFTSINCKTIKTNQFCMIASRSIQLNVITIFTNENCSRLFILLKNMNTFLIRKIETQFTSITNRSWNSWMRKNTKIFMFVESTNFEITIFKSNTLKTKKIKWSTIFHASFSTKKIANSINWLKICIVKSSNIKTILNDFEKSTKTNIAIRWKNCLQKTKNEKSKNTMSKSLFE